MVDTLVIRQKVRRGGYTTWIGAGTLRITASRSGLMLGDEFISDERLRFAFFCARRDLSFVRFETTQTWIDVAVATRDEGEELIAAVGLADGTRAVESAVVRSFPAAIPFVLLAAPVMYLLAWYLNDEARWARLFMGTVFGGMAAAWVITARKLVIGMDGVALCTFHKRWTFFPYPAIKAARADGTQLIVEFVGGGAWHLRGSLTRGTVEERERMCALAGRIEAARKATESIESHAALDRVGRTCGEWMMSLRAMGRGDTYRSAHITREVLWNVLERSVETNQRIAAAIVLSEEGSPDDRARMGVAAKRSAHPTMRAALATFAVRRPDDATLTHLLAC